MLVHGKSSLTQPAVCLHSLTDKHHLSESVFLHRLTSDGEEAGKSAYTKTERLFIYMLISCRLAYW